MPTESAIARRVAKGAKLLDELEPGWHQRINLMELRLSSCTQCVCGQLAYETANKVVQREVCEDTYSAYHSFRNFLGRKLTRRGRKNDAKALTRDPWRFGFNTKTTGEEYRELDDKWTRQVVKRLKADAK